jgi:DNA end-binding protein Ku
VARAIWSGSISFGLVSVPVSLFNATAPRDVRFHQFERDSGRRIHYRRVTAEEPAEWLRESTASIQAPAPRETVAEPEREASAPPSPSAPETEVAYEDLVKGYEVDRDEFVLLDPDELRALRPEQTQTIEIEEFVDLAVIDPVYFEKSYHVAPKRGVGAEKPYALLVMAMERAGKVAIGRFVLRTKEYLAAIRPTQGALMLETLFFADEVRGQAEIENLPVEAPVADRELKVAEQLIALLETDWDPARHRDAYRERVLDLIRSGAPARVASPEPAALAEAAGTRIPDLLEALRRSVEAAKEQDERPAERPRRRSTRAG